MLKWLNRIIFVCLLLLAFGLGALLGYENQEAVTLVVLGFPVEGFTLGFIITFALLVGALLGYVLSLWSVVKAKAQTRSLKKQVQSAG